MYTIDASVHISALNRTEQDSMASQAFLEYVLKSGLAITEPTLLLVELSAAIAHVFNSAVHGVTLARTVRSLPVHIWVPLDDVLADAALSIAAEYRLRGADAIYAAVARQFNTTLVTLDQQQLSRLPAPFVVKRPHELLPDFQQHQPGETRQARSRRKPSTGK